MGGRDIPTQVDTDDAEYVTIATKGNATDFGESYASSSKMYTGAVCKLNSRIDGGGKHPANDNVIQFVTIASTLGNAVDFGDLQLRERFTWDRLLMFMEG